jgi:hypothetical protein
MVYDEVIFDEVSDPHKPLLQLKKLTNTNKTKNTAFIMLMVIKQLAMHACK